MEQGYATTRSKMAGSKMTWEEGRWVVYGSRDYPPLASKKMIPKFDKENIFRQRDRLAMFLADRTVTRVPSPIRNNGEF